MGFSAQVQQPQTGGGKSGPVSKVASQAPISSAPVDPGYGYDPSQGQNQQASGSLGKGGGQATYSPISGQQKMGSPNPYPNTIGMGDNQGNHQMGFGGKGKGGVSSAPSGDSMGYGGSNSLIENTYHPELANKPYNPQ